MDTIRRQKISQRSSMKHKTPHMAVVARMALSLLDPMIEY